MSASYQKPLDSTRPPEMDVFKDRMDFKTETEDKSLPFIDTGTLYKRKNTLGDEMETSTNVYDAYFDVDHESSSGTSQREDLSDKQVKTTSHRGDKEKLNYESNNAKLCDTTDNKGIQEPSNIEQGNNMNKEAVYICEICKITFDRKNYLAYHMRSHGFGSLACHICRYTFTDKKKLELHLKTHPMKTVACEHCDYKCDYVGILRIHMRTHTREKPYSCAHCTYTCAVKSSLIPHMRIHTGDRPYKCHLCNHNYKDKCNLIQHMRLHTGEKKYSCHHCTYMSYTEGE